MKLRGLVIALTLITNAHLVAQTPDEYISQGRAYLAVTDLNAANRCFSNSVALSPYNQTANVLYAATRLLTLPYQPSNGDFLTRLGFPGAGRDIYNWTAVLLLDVYGAPFLPTGVNASELTAVLRTNILPTVVAAEANLAKVTDTNFTLALSASETRIVDVTLDYGDIQMSRAWLRAAEYCIYNASSWNIEAELTAIRAMFDPNDPTTLEQGLIAYPELLTFATTNDLNAAKLAFQNGVDRYLAASLFIRSNRPPNAIRVFNPDPEVAADEERFRRTLAELRDSITEAVTLSVETNYTVFLGAPFNYPMPPRSFLPVIRGNGFGLATLPDPSFGGAVYGMSRLTVDQLLAGYLQPIPTIAPGFIQSGRFAFPLNLAKNRGYVIQVSTNLSSWTDCLAFFASDWTYNFTDPNIGASPRRFYRVADRTENMPPPTNDNFADRILIPGLDLPVSSYNPSATVGPGELTWTEGIGQTIWWSWTSTLSGEVAVVAPFSKFVGVFTGTTLHGLVQIARGWGQVSFNAQAGTTYQVLVDSGWAYDPEPTVSLVISRPPTLAVTSPAQNAQFYSPANVAIAGLAWDPSGQVPRVTIDGNFHHETNANNFSFMHTNLPVGHYYLLFSVTNGSGAQALDSRSFWVRPSNDMFSNAIPIVGSPLLVTGSNRGADREHDEPYHGGNYGQASIWWSWTPTNSGPVMISCTLGNGSDPSLGVYTGDSVYDLVPVSSTIRSGGTAMVQFTATAAQTYKIAVDSYSSVAGDIHLGINDAFPLVFGDLSGTFDSQTFYRVSIPSGLASLQISITGGVGDCDLYVRHGSPPTLNYYDYAPYLDGNDETVNIPNPAAGDWYIMLHAFGSYSGVTLLAQ